MPPGKNSDRNEVKTPEQQRDITAVSAPAFRHGSKHPGHGHEKAAWEKEHLAYLATVPEKFDIIHYVTILNLRKKPL